MHDTIDRLVRRRAEQHGDKPMVIDPATRITYGELDDTTRTLVAGFLEAGVGKGTRVGLIMPNCVQWVQIAVALARIGAVLASLFGTTGASVLLVRPLGQVFFAEDAGTTLARPGPSFYVDFDAGVEP